MLTQLDPWLARLSLDRQDRPLIGVSACLLGHPVRYDGDHKHEPLVTDTLAHYVQLRHFCPEVGIGMSVPRPPIQVVQLAQDTRVRGVAAPHDDVTEALHEYAMQVPETLDGFVLKARSPSCGVGTTPVMNALDEQIATGYGEFARTLQQRFPCAPLVDESTLVGDMDILELLLQLYLYRAWRETMSLAQVYRWREQLGADTPTPTFTHYLERLAAHSS